MVYQNNRQFVPRACLYFVIRGGNLGSHTKKNYRSECGAEKNEKDEQTTDKRTQTIPT